MSTRNVPLTETERVIMSQWATRAFFEADTAALLSIPDSPKERAALADREMIARIKDKLSPFPVYDYT